MDQANIDEMAEQVAAIPQEKLHSQSTDNASNLTLVNTGILPRDMSTTFAGGIGTLQDRQVVEENSHSHESLGGIPIDLTDSSSKLQVKRKQDGGGADDNYASAENISSVAAVVTPPSMTQLQAIAADQSATNLMSQAPPQVVTGGNLSQYNRRLSSTHQVPVGGKHHHSNSKSAQLLHRKATGYKIGVVTTSDLIMTTNLEDIAATTNLPQWLIYSWTCKPKDKNLTDKRTQQAIGDLFVLKQYALPVALAFSLPVTQQDLVARTMLLIFQNLHKTGQQRNQQSPSAALQLKLQDRRRSDSTTSKVSASSDSGHEDEATQPVSTSLKDLSVSSSPGASKNASNAKLPPMPAGIRRRDHCIAFLESIVAEEVEECKSESTLFRSNNITSKLLTMYSNQVAKDYLIGILETVIAKVIDMGTMEVDPTKLQIPTTSGQDGAGTQLNANMARLIQATQLVLDAVVESVPRCPAGLRKLCFIISRQVEMKFGVNRRATLTTDNTPEHTMLASELQRQATQETPPSPSLSFNAQFKQRLTAVSGFIFLRFICPAIVTPESCGLVKGQLLPAQRRTLVLISKLMQNLANGVKFGGKEAFMTPANSFLSANEKAVNSFCEALQTYDVDQLYWTTDSVDDDNSRTAEYDAAVIQTMNNMNLHMEKINARLESLVISEVMTYTVFGALKSVLRRFELIERVYDVASGETNTNRYQPEMSRRDQDLLGNVILLGGLEEVLLMNRYALLRAVLHPGNFMGGRSQLSVPPINAHNNASGLNREMDTIARSVVQILGPHGGCRLVDVIDWVIDQEVMKRREMHATQMAGHPDADIIRKCLDGPTISKSDEDKFAVAQHNSTFGTSMMFKLIISFMFAHTKEYLKPVLGEVCLELWKCGLSIEMDPANLGPDANLKQNLDNLVICTLKIVHAITDNIALVPESMRRLIRVLFVKLGGKLDLEDQSNLAQNERAGQIVTNFIFMRFYCVIIGAPSFYGIMVPEVEGQHQTGDQQQLQNRMFILISYMLRFLATKLMPDKDPLQEEAEMPFEEEILGPMLTEWKSSTSNFIRAILHAIPSLPSGIMADRSGSLPSLAESRISKVSAYDMPVPISSSSRAKGLLFMRKVLSPQCVKQLKNLIKVKSSQEQSRMTKGTPTKLSDSELTPNSDSRDDMSGVRAETLQYRLMDRVRIVLSTIYKDPESMSLVKDQLAARRAKLMQTIPAIEEQSETSTPASQSNTQSHSDSEKAPAKSPKVAVKGKATTTLSIGKDKDKRHKDAYQEQEENTLASSGAESKSMARLDLAEPAKKDGKEPSRWSILPHPHSMAQATKNIVKGIFASGAKQQQPHMMEHEELVHQDTSGHPLQKRKTLSRMMSGSKGNLNTAATPEQERGLMSIVRRNRGEKEKDKDKSTSDVTPPATTSKSSGNVQHALPLPQQHAQGGGSAKMMYTQLKSDGGEDTAGSPTLEQQVDKQEVKTSRSMPTIKNQQGSRPTSIVEVKEARSPAMPKAQDRNK